MEDVLDLYKQPYDPLHPVVCYDEWRRALISETRPGLPLQPGQVRRVDYEYERHGVAYLQMMFEPLAGKRRICITPQHTMHEFAQGMHWLVDDLYPRAELIGVTPVIWLLISPLPCTKSFPPLKPGAFSRNWSFTARPNMAVG